MSSGDGRNPKFRVLCKKCNSYKWTIVTLFTRANGKPGLNVVCTKCDNKADDLDEEWTQ
jgi:RNase P subunit RPR2